MFKNQAIMYSQLQLWLKNKRVEFFFEIPLATSELLPIMRLH
ncbi:hypothetical protein CSC12_2325 [Klebsiella michiganensis]|nr:hypothetical protein CSC12_2325 [Klebsiella michiganensis]